MGGTQTYRGNGLETPDVILCCNNFVVQQICGAMNLRCNNNFVLKLILGCNQPVVELFVVP